MLTETNRKWNELDYYKEGQTLYGRDEEVYSISNGIKRNIQTVIYGQSGVGKSSLLFAGVFPELRKDSFFPIFIRLGVIPPTDYVKAIKEQVLEEAKSEKLHLGKPALNCTIKDDEVYKKGDLWSFFHTVEFTDDNGEIFIPVLVFDQFEEVLNDKKTFASAKELLLELYTLLDNNRIITENLIQYSNYRVVLSLREDYLYCLEELIDKFNLSEFRHNRYRVKWLKERNARTVITKTFGDALKSDEVDDICSRIIEKATNESGDISTICLSLVCSILEMRNQNKVIEGKDFGSMDDYIYKYYSLKMDVVSYKARKYLEQHLITPDGRRNSVDFNEAVRSGQVTQPELELLISNRLLRRVTLTGNTRIEYIHDIIPKVVVKKKNQFFYYIKNTFKERHNIAGTASKSEFIVSLLSYCICMALLCTAFTALYDMYPVVAVAGSGLSMYFVLKLLLSLLIRRAHDVGLSGWRCLNFKLFEESEINPYVAKTSYHYAQTVSLIDFWLGRYSKKSQFLNVAINRYEFIASLVKECKTVIWCLLLLCFADWVDNENLYGVVQVFVIIMAALIIFNVQLAYSKRLNYNGINPFYGMIPVYDLVLFVICFKKDTLETPAVCTKNWKRLYLISGFVLLSFFVTYATYVFCTSFIIGFIGGLLHSL